VPAAHRRAPGLDHHGPGAFQPTDRLSVYLSRTPAPTTVGQAPSLGWPLFRGLHLHSPPSSGWRAFITVDNHSSSLGAMRPTLFRMAPQPAVTTPIAHPHLLLRRPTRQLAPRCSTIITLHPPHPLTFPLFAIPHVDMRRWLR